METFSIEFDPAWLEVSASTLALERPFYCLGGEALLASRALTRLWTDARTNEQELQAATASFLASAMSSLHRTIPHWVAKARAQLASPVPLGADAIARQLGMHPRWVAHAYRQAIGEGVHDTLRRRRVEQAIQQLRSTEEAIADIAVAAGFCDQSHLNRALRRLTGRTPVEIRAERAPLNALMS